MINVKCGTLEGMLVYWGHGVCIELGESELIAKYLYKHQLFMAIFATETKYGVSLLHNAC